MKITTFLKHYFSEDIWTTFAFEFNKLRHVEFSPLFKDEEIIWPERIKKTKR